MSYIPRTYSASSRSVAEEAVKKGYLTYPGVCFISDEKLWAWVDRNNHLNYVSGENQITNIQYEHGTLLFYSNEKLVDAVNIKLSSLEVDKIVEMVSQEAHLDDYLKVADFFTILDDRIGDIGASESVSDYIKNLSYSSLNDVPIRSLVGTLSKTVVLSEQSTGVYNVRGQYVIGGDLHTVRTGKKDTLFLIDREGTKITITSLSSETVQIYHLNEDGTVSSDQYITDAWLEKKHFASETFVLDAINELYERILERDTPTREEITQYIDNVIVDRIDHVLDSEIESKLDSSLDEALESKISGLDRSDIVDLFHTKPKIKRGNP